MGNVTLSDENEYTWSLYAWYPSIEEMRQNGGGSGVLNRMSGIQIML